MSSFPRLPVPEFVLLAYDERWLVLRHTATSDGLAIYTRASAPTGTYSGSFRSVELARAWIAELHKVAP